MQLDAAQVYDPGETGSVIHNQLFGGTAGRKCEGHGSQPGRAIRGRALLIEGLPFGTVHESLQNDGAVANAVEGSWRDRKVVADEVEL